MDKRLRLHLLMLIITTLLATNLECLKRISTIATESNSCSDNYWDIYQSQSLQHKYYCYETENPELIDSVVVHIQATTTQNYVIVAETDTTYTLDYEGEMYIENGNRHYSYTRSDGFNYIITRDNQYRIIYKAPYDNTHPDSYRSWIYNSNGRLDEFAWRNNIDNTYRCVFNYADEENSPIQSGTVYFYHPNFGWEYDSSFSYAYPADNYTTPYYLYIEEALDVAGNVGILRNALNPYYQASTFSYYDFYNITCLTTAAGYQVLLETDDGYGNTNSYQLVFNTDGYASQYNTGDVNMYSNSSRTLDFTWDDLVENEDEVEPVSELITLAVYPNPFNPITTVRYSLPKDCDVNLSVYNIKGQKVRTLLSGKQAKGSHSLTWNGEDEEGRQLSSGLYLIRLSGNNGLQMLRKVILSK